MLPHNQPIDPKNPLGAKAARDGIPALRSEAARLSSAIAACSAHVRLYQMKIEVVLNALAPDLATLPEEAFATAIELSLQPGDFDTAEILLRLMQDADADLTVDDCLNEIFIVGLAAMAHRIIPS